MTTNATTLSKDRLTLLYHLSQVFNSSLDLDEVLNRVMDEIIRATGAERGFVMLREADGTLVFRTARGIDQRTIDDPQFQISRSVVEVVAREGQPILSSDALQDARFSGRQSIQGLKLRSILCAPLKIKDRVSGLVYVDNQLRAGIFTQADLEMLTAIASSAAIAIENARLYQIAIEKGRLERELQVAREVQTSLLPRETPHVPGWEFAARWKPARQVSGDFYDFVDTDRGLGIVIADVSDKGMPAALFMALSRSIIRASVCSARSPAEGIAQANRLICADSVNSMFVTLFYAEINPLIGQIVYVNAGHNPPFLYRAGRDDFTVLSRTGMPLGLFEGIEFQQQTVELESGDFMLLYTDGVSEAIDPANHLFGEERLHDLLIKHRDAPTESIAEVLEGTLTEFIGTANPSDDITFVVARRLNRVEKKSG